MRSRRSTDDGVLVRLESTIRAAGATPASEPTTAARAWSGRTTILLTLPGDEALVVAAPESILVSGEGGPDQLEARARASAAIRRREHERRERLARSADWIMVFVDSIQTARTAVEIHRALIACAVCTTGAFAGVVYIPDRGVGPRFRPVREVDSDPDLPMLSVLPGIGREVRVLSAGESVPGGDSRALAPVLEALAARQLLCAGIGDRSVLMLAERRRDRVFTSGERDLVAWLVRQAGRALA